MVVGQASTILLFTLFFTPILLVGRTTKEQEWDEDYFVLHPEERSLEHIIEQIQNDLGFSIESIKPHTDTSLLFLRASSRSYNPFNLPVKKIEFVLWQGTLQNGNKVLDTILTFQMIGITDASK